MGGRKYVASTKAESVLIVATIPKAQEPMSSFEPSAENDSSSAGLVNFLISRRASINP